MYKIWLFWLLVFPWPGLAQSVPGFFTSVFDQFRPAVEARYREDYRAWLARFRLADSQQNRRGYFQLRFLHDLFTCDSATDGPCSGALQIPYFWHWVDPNPRHGIQSNISGRKLIEEKPPRGFGRYKTRADVDRIPSLFFNDLLKKNAGYSHRLTGPFYTFGWCSEREMSFNLLVGLLGYKARIMQLNNHVWSEVWLDAWAASGKKTALIAVVDNTYDTVRWSIGAGRQSDWLNGFGTRRMVRWYNNKARNKAQISQVKNMDVSSAVKKRIVRQIKQFYGLSF